MFRRIFTLIYLSVLLATFTQAQEELTVRQVGQTLEFEFRLDDPSSFQLFYSTNQGVKWTLIQEDCLGPLKELPNGRASVVWKVLECEESFVREDVIFKLTACSCSPVEFDGYTYDVVQIGKQCWFAENLRTTHYANGDAIPGELTGNEWCRMSAGAQAVYCEGRSTYFDEPCDEVDNLEDFGRLYNWYAVDDARGLCPSGWHVPTDAEYMTLEMELGMSESEANSDGGRGTDQGAQMKATACDSPSWNGTNSSSFSALAGGGRFYSEYSSRGQFRHVGRWAYFWSSSPNGFNAWYRLLDSGDGHVYRNNNFLRHGFSVRCVRDE